MCVCACVSTLHMQLMLVDQLLYLLSSQFCQISLISDFVVICLIVPLERRITSGVIRDLHITILSHSVILLAINSASLIWSHFFKPQSRFRSYIVKCSPYQRCFGLHNVNWDLANQRSEGICIYSERKSVLATVGGGLAKCWKFVQHMVVTCCVFGSTVCKLFIERVKI